MTLREKLRESLNLIPCMLLIVLVFVVLLLGWATATECAAWGVLGALLIAWWSGALTLGQLLDQRDGRHARHLHDHADPGRRLVHVDVHGLHRHPGGAGGLGGRPAALSPYVLIAALTVMYIMLGTALDGISMIVLTTVVVLPMVQKAGFDLVWFGIFLVLIVEMAEVSPPVGFNLFVLQTMSGWDSNTVALAALPFFFLLVAGRGHHHGVPADRDGRAQWMAFPN